MRPKYEIEIDCSGREVPDTCLTYGALYSEGDTLEQLINNASISIVDQDGGEQIVEADADWMQEAVEAKFWKLQGILRNDGEGLNSYFLRAALEVGYRDVFNRSAS